MGNEIRKWEREAAVAKAEQLCANVDYCSKRCENKGCTPASCVESMTTFVEAVNNTWIIGLGYWFGRELYIGTQTCSRWVLDLNARIPDDFRSKPCISGCNVIENDIPDMYGGATTVHYTFDVVLCDGTKISADNGAWGGRDHIFIRSR